MKFLLRYLFKPYSIFFYAAVICLLIYLFYDNAVIDVQVKGNYEDIIRTTYLLPSSVLFFSGWLIYMALERYLYSGLLTWMHATGCILAILIVYSYLTRTPNAGEVVKVYESHGGKYNPGVREFWIVRYPQSGKLLLMILLTQLFLFFNIIKEPKQKKKV